MRINRFIASSTGLSRRAADKAVAEGKVVVNGQVAKIGQEVSGNDEVTVNGNQIRLADERITIVLNKPPGYIVSRDGQGGKTVYELLPEDLRQLKPVGRLDKYSSGLLLMTNDGQLAQQLTHPSYQKTKVYEVGLDKNLEPLHQQMISDHGIQLEDGVSKLQLESLSDEDRRSWRVTMHEGRNRQIRRTFAALGYEVKRLHRIKFGNYQLHTLAPGKYLSL